MGAAGLKGKAQAQLDAILSFSEDAIVAIDANEAITTWNAGAERLLGWPPESVIGADLSGIVPPDRSEDYEGIFRRLAEGEGVSSFETVARHLEGFPIDVSLSASPLGGSGSGAILILRDITSRKTLEDELIRQSSEDSVTGLGNRHLLRQRIEHAVNRQSRSETPFALLLLDLDDFKIVNDSLGHAAGDELLRQVADRIRACIRPTDTAARIGGDEFAVLLEEMDQPEDSRLVADRILDMLIAPFDLADFSAVTRASLGICCSSPEIDADSLLRNADTAMNAAKAQGKNSIAMFEPGMHLEAIRRLSLKKDLQLAIDNGDFFLQYQPIVNLATGELSGVEALVRWEHEKRGVVPPNEFIGLAEESGLILPLGRLVLEKACAQVASWNGSFTPKGLKIGVNVSTKQLHERPFVSDLIKIMDRYTLDPRTLVIEITESIFLEDTDEVTRVLHSVRDTGASLAIDDFGTGYSSLGYLEKMPINILKIDRAFIRGLAKGPENAAVAKAVIHLAQALELQTVAEGIEVGEQVARLRALNCPLGQGFYFAKPLHPNAVKQIFEAGAFGFDGLDEGQPEPKPDVITLVG